MIGRSIPSGANGPVLVVELREQETLSDETILAALRGQVTSWWIPDAVIRLAQMPLASTGKIDKMRLQIEVWQRLRPDDWRSNVPAEVKARGKRPARKNSARRCQRE